MEQDKKLDFDMTAPKVNFQKDKLLDDFLIHCRKDIHNELPAFSRFMFDRLARIIVDITDIHNHQKMIFDRIIDLDIKLQKKELDDAKPKRTRRAKRKVKRKNRRLRHI